MTIRSQFVCTFACLFPLASICGATTATKQLFGDSRSEVQSATRRPAPSPAHDAASAARISHGTKNDAVDLARLMLDNSLTRMNEYPKPKFWEQVKILRMAFGNGFSFKNDSCGQDVTVMYTLKTDYYNPEKHKKNVIHICKGYNPNTELMAQDLIHEVSHLVLTTMEGDATEFEMVVTRLGGGYPVINGYIKFNEGLSQEDLEWLGYAYLKLALGIDSQLAFEYQILRANIIYNDYAAFLRNIKKLTVKMPGLLKFKDIEGQTLHSIAVSYGRTDFVRSIDQLSSGQ